LEGVLINLLSQALWELALVPIFRASTSQDAARVGSFTEALGRAHQSLEAVSAHGEVDEDALAQFLDSRSVRTLIRTLYLFRLDSNMRGVEQARADFEVLWDEVGLGAPDIGMGVFDALVEAIEDTLDEAIREGLLSAHEAKSSARHRMTEEHLEALNRKLSLLIDDELDPNQAEQFEQELRAEVVRRNSHITPPDFFGAPRVEIDKLYVPPLLVGPRLSDTENPRIAVSDWVGVLFRGVVLGNPGGGKSTLARKLCHAVGARSAGWEIAGSWYTPVLVELRAYGAAKTDRGLSIREFIEDLAHSSLQLEVPDGAIEYLLLAGRLFVVFDGLDELLETRRRQEIRNDVESFARRYPTVPILVTSRSVGYEQAPLDPDLFSTYRLGEFTDEQVAQYAFNWFALDEDLLPDEQVEKATAFVEESRTVPDLRVNPLLLALMCNFYRGQNYLPRHLPEIYENCARMLFETWDRHRGIITVLPIAEHIRPAMRFLANWIYADEGLQSGVTERELVEAAVDFLLKWRFDDEHEARHAASHSFSSPTAHSSSISRQTIWYPLPTRPAP
jgi:hypothetical protein